MKKLFTLLALILVIFSINGCTSGQTITIHFQTDGGNEIDNIVVSAEDASFELPTPVKQGSIFEGWYVDEAMVTPFSFSELLTTTEITVYAKWIIIQYTITFEVGGGSSVDPILQESGITITAPPIPSRTGYTFDGWYSDIGLTMAYMFTIMPEENITLYAKWIETSEESEFTFSLKEDQTYEIAGYTGTETDIVIPSTYLGLLITSIGANAFDSNASITSIIIPAGVISIGDRAFYCASDITSVIFEEGSQLTSIGDRAFYNTSSLTSIIIPAGVTSIGDHSFDNASHLTSVTFEAGSQLTSIGYSMFQNAISLTSINIPTGVTSIRDQAFYNASSLTSVIIPAGVISIGDYAFDNCANLTIYAEAPSKPSGWTSTWNLDSRPVVWGYNLTNQISIVFEVNGGSDVDPILQESGTTITAPSIPTKTGYTFNGWYSDIGLTVAYMFTIMPEENITLYAKWIETSEESEFTFSLKEDNTYEITGYTGTETDIVIPSTYLGLPVASIGYRAFYGNDSITNIIIPAGVTSIGYSAFHGAHSLTNVSIPAGVTSIGERAFQDTTALTSVIFEEESQLMSIGDYAFYGVVSLTNIVIPAGVTSIGNHAFTDAFVLTSIIFEKGSQLTSIGDRAFDSAYNLTSIIIPAEVTSMGEYAFYNCVDLTINAEALSEPSGWDLNWNPSNCPVVWGYNLTNQISIVFEVNGGSDVDPISQESGTTITAPMIPTKAGYTFDGWYSDIELTTAYTFTTMPEENITLYAKWIEISEESEFTFSLKEDNTYEITGYTGTETNIVIPRAHLGISVTSIITSVFNDFNTLGSIIIPIEITNIAWGAFYQCPSLVIFAEATTEPSGWVAGWNLGDRPIYWGIDIISREFTFEENGGSSIENINGYFIMDEPISTKENFYFIGWFDNIELSGEKINFPYYTSDSSKTTLYAFWSDTPPLMDGTSFETAYSIDIDDQKLVEIDSEGQMVYFKFTPLESGNYYIFSSGLFDTYGYLYDARLNEITHEDGGGQSDNFAIYYDYEKDLHYYFAIKLYSSSEIGQFTIDLMPSNDTNLYDFTLKEDNTYEVFSYIGDQTNIAIPSSFLGKPVTSIGSYAFSDCTNITNVIVPNSITLFGMGAFNGCINLISINVPSSVISIGDTAFSDCSSLPSIYIPNSVLNVGFYTFSGCSSLVISAEVTSKPVGWDLNWNPSDCHVDWGYNQISIIFEANGGSSVDPILQESGITITAPAIPTRTGYTFDGWYSDIGLTTAYTFTTMPLENITLYAKWIEINEESEFIFSLKEDNTYEIIGYIGTEIDIVIPETYLGLPVTSIGSNAFDGNTNITSAIIPVGITSIEEYAFCDATALTSVTFEAGSQLTKIGDWAFQSTISLKSIIIPSGVTSIGEYAFGRTTALASVTFEAGSQLISIENRAFSYATSLTNIIIPAGVTNIGYDAFKSTTVLTSVTFEEGSQLTSIESGLFFDAISLTSIIIPNGVTSIGKNAFAYTHALTSIIIPAGVTSIGSSAFRDTWALTSVTFEAGSQLTLIGDLAFAYTSALTSIVIPAGVTHLGNNVFFDASALTSIIIPAGVTSIGYRAFSGAYALTSVTFEAGSQLTSIGAYAFNYAISLTDIIIPAGVTSIGDHAFYNVRSLTGIIIPAGVTSIGEYAFDDCLNLTINVEAPSIPSGWDSNWNPDDCHVEWNYSG